MHQAILYEEKRKYQFFLFFLVIFLAFLAIFCFFSDFFAFFLAFCVLFLVFLLFLCLLFLLFLVLRFKRTFLHFYTSTSSGFLIFPISFILSVFLLSHSLSPICSCLVLLVLSFPSSCVVYIATFALMWGAEL